MFDDDEIFLPRRPGDTEPQLLTLEEFEERYDRFLDACLDTYNDSSYVPRFRSI